MSSEKLIFEATCHGQEYPYWDRSLLRIIERNLKPYITDSFQYYTGGGCESVLHRLVNGHVVVYAYGICFEMSKHSWGSAGEYAYSEEFGREDELESWRKRCVWIEGKSTMDELWKVKFDILELIGKITLSCENSLRRNNQK